MIKKMKESLQETAPVVVILGHIDHGKTTLLSKIRERDLTKKEFGGITQHIGAYQVKHQGKQITFIDTPGHVAFSKMRARGAKVTDLVVLVIAADDGVMPQTRESLEHIRAAKVPFLVAINKIDLPQANPKMVKEQLQKEMVLVEDLGGDVVCVEVSAKTGKGIDELLEMILLLAEMEGLRKDAAGSLEAVVIESSLDYRRGPISTVLVKNGSLRVGDEIKAEGFLGKVKAMFDENGKRVKEAGPSKPVEVLGFKEVPLIGSKVAKVGASEAIKKEVVKKKDKPKSFADKGKFKIVLKSDVKGTLEALVDSLPDEVQLIFQAVGDVNESDVLFAATTGAEIIGFNVRIPSGVAKLAETERVKIRPYNIIYELLEDIKRQLTKPEISEEILGEAEIVAEFENEKERIAGCRVKEGRITKEDKLRLQRGEKILGNMKIKTMKHKKEDITEATKGKEFGAVFVPLLDFKIGDVIISYNRSVNDDFTKS